MGLTSFAIAASLRRDRETIPQCGIAVKTFFPQRGKTRNSLETRGKTPDLPPQWTTAATEFSAPQHGNAAMRQ
jgi:hypothetical protein